ncbi:YppE family protein [Cytobacillus sp. S13-E01]|uniref:YppE family protein n=1 Tax=Cytobacillus sp. S13-E01 TaxID=3031326 RepID=UPI0023D7FB47|nr:YppE family protein [Cytobacillus sp. S13-E01]MDF0726270.1 YppE family protein [Cytobacillus sp. S13-E01]
MSKYKELYDLSIYLLECNDKSLRQLESIKNEEGYEPDFFHAVKPFADKVHEALKEWKKLSLEWIKEQHPKYIYQMQIDTAYENIELVTVQSFYQDTRIKKFKDMHQSIQYLLQSIIEQINERNGAQL